MFWNHYRVDAENFLPSLVGLRSGDDAGSAATLPAADFRSGQVELLSEKSGQAQVRIHFASFYWERRLRLADLTNLPKARQPIFFNCTQTPFPPFKDKGNSLWLPKVLNSSTRLSYPMHLNRWVLGESAVSHLYTFFEWLITCNLTLKTFASLDRSGLTTNVMACVRFSIIGRICHQCLTLTRGLLSNHLCFFLI